MARSIERRDDEKRNGVVGVSSSLVLWAFENQEIGGRRFKGGNLGVTCTTRVGG